MVDLSRFHAAQEKTIETALTELRNGDKQSHWMWYVFPQLKSLGRSSTANFYGISDLEEARAYLADATLRRNLTEATQRMLLHVGRKPSEILGSVDALKLRSSATLFRAAGGGPEFQLILDEFYNGEPCKLTISEIEEG